MTHARTLGIDLGTNRLFAAVTRKGQVPIALDIGGEDAPGLLCEVALTDDPDEGQMLVGYPATKPFALFGRERMAHGLLRLLGQSYRAVSTAPWAQNLPFCIVENERGDVLVELRNKRFSPEQLLATLLAQIGAYAKDAGCDEPLEATIALPVALGDAQRRAIARGAQLAGFGGLSFVHAPHAAAIELSRRYRLPLGHSLVVLDWGAGALDGAIVTQEAEGLELKRVVGDSALGTLDLDGALVEEHMVELRAQGCAELTKSTLCQVRLAHAFMRARLRLEDADAVPIHLPHLGAADGASFDGTTELRRETLEAHCALMLKRAEALIAELVGHADVAEDAPVSVVVRGGMCTVSGLQKKLEKALGKAWRNAGGAKPTPIEKLLARSVEHPVKAKAASHAEDADAAAKLAHAEDEAPSTPEASDDAPAQPQTEQAAADEVADERPAIAALAAPEPEIDAGTEAIVAIGAATFNQRLAASASDTPTSHLGAAVSLVIAESDAAAPTVKLHVPENTPLPHAQSFTLTRDEATLNVEQGPRDEGTSPAGDDAQHSVKSSRWQGELRIHGVNGKGASATLHIDSDGLIELEATDPKGNALEVAWLARPGLTDDELMVLARAAWAQKERREERLALVAAEERATALVASAERQLEGLGEENDALAQPLGEQAQALRDVLAQPLDLQQIELFEHERTDFGGEAGELPPSPRQLRCERLLERIYALEIALGRAAQASSRPATQEAAS